ncbi:unnamed protein product [Linum tenue]|uniref:F-box domain-containing protein n=1 Tax=Linum tenue TaxID=586396 RepID=A0AAV0NJA6_9ROSI|nr:unnamed protein product [Linum tenue]
MKRVCESEYSADRITDLPADVIQRILMYLPIKDAAKTGVLSRKWRCHWRRIPELVFDDDFAQISSDLAESESKVMNKQVMLNIYRSLLLHDGRITKFVLSVPGLIACREIDQIILYLSTKGVQHLKFVFTGGNDEEEGDFQMHSSLFSVSRLKSLKLQSCEFKPPSWFVGFTNLTRLVLEYVTSPVDFFRDFLPKCPMLEYFRAIYPDGPAGQLEIVAPFLKSFIFVGYFQNISFKCTPLLSYVVLHLTESETPDLVSLFASLPALEQLYVNNEVMKYLAPSGRNSPTRLPIPLHRLKVLEMNTLVFDGSPMECVFVSLIMSSPNLHRLTVQLCDQPAGSEVSCLRSLLEAGDCRGSDCLQHLRKFRIEDSRGTQVELDLVRFVLATASLLELIHITPYKKLGTKKVTKFMKEAIQYKRASKEAEVRFYWDDDEE